MRARLFDGDAEHVGIGGVAVLMLLLLVVAVGWSSPEVEPVAVSPSREVVNAPPPEDWAQQAIYTAAQKWHDDQVAEFLAAVEADMRAKAEAEAAAEAERQRQAAAAVVPLPVYVEPAPAPTPAPVPAYTWSASSGSGGAWAWEGTVRSAMGALGIPEGYLAGIIGQLNSESGGNQYAYNGWDSNAAAGIPSQGLMQVIPPTFAAYTAPGCTDIYDAYCNVYAGLNWSKSRYGFSRFDEWAAGSHRGY